MRISSVNNNPNFKASFKYKDKQYEKFNVAGSCVASPENRGNKNTEICLYEVRSEGDYFLHRCPQTYSHKATYDIYNPFFGFHVFNNVPYVSQTYGSLNNKPAEKLEWTFDEFTRRTEELEDEAVKKALLKGVQESIIQGDRPKMPMEVLEKMISEKKPVENLGFSEKRIADFRLVALDLTFEIIKKAFQNMN